MLITVMYSCKACGLKDRKVIVPERGENQDVVDYMNGTVTECIMDDHARKSPGCNPESLQDLMVPFSETKGIGFEP